MISFRASSLDRILSCNGSITVAPLFPSTESDDATEGSVLHHLIAARAVSELGATEPEDGLQAPKVAPGWSLPAFSAWIVDWGIRLLQDEIPQDWALMVEEEFAYSYKHATAFARPEGDPLIEAHAFFLLTGHIDILAISPDGKHAKALDWKTGQIGADPAESNWQASGYLALLKRAYPDLESAEFIMAQPRIDEEATGIPRVSRVSLDGEQLNKLNAYLATEIGKAMANSMQTDSSVKACKYCPVAMNRPWLCPSLAAEQFFMKAQLTEHAIEAMKTAPDDRQLVSWVASGRTLAAPQEAAEELLHTRLDQVGYVDGESIRVTRKVTKGSYEVLEPEKFMEAAQAELPAPAVARSVNWSMTRLKDEIATAKNIPKTSKKGASADGVFEDKFRPLVKQGERRMLVIQQL
jgi:hypothetical protein